MSLIQQIEKIITGDRNIVHAASGYGDVELSGFGLASADPDLNLEEGSDYYTPTYSHYRIRGEGKSQREALKVFWEDYDKQGPYGDGEIFWRQKPELWRDRDFARDCNNYLIVVRFSINDSITSS